MGLHPNLQSIAKVAIQAKATLVQGWAHDLSMDHMTYVGVTSKQDSCLFSCMEIDGHPSIL